MSTAAPSTPLRTLFRELEQLFVTETEARVSTSVEAAEHALTEHLNQSVRRLRGATGFDGLAGILCDSATRFAKGCAVFRISEDKIAGEYLQGAAEEAAARFREIRFGPSEAAAFAGAMESREPVVALATGAEVSPGVVEALGHASGDRVYLFPLTVDGSMVGMLYAAGVLDAAALELLAQAAAAILEARQRGRKPAAAANSELVSIEPAVAQPATSAPDWDELSPADQRLHLRAQRFARVKVAEMRLYRPDAIKAGRAQQDLYTAFKEAIDQGREEFRRTFVTASPTMADYFHLELVRTLANDNPEWLGGKYPGRLV